ncbi:MAG: helix-turn-helix domain-containing protein [Pseudonocardiaceae bacterium]
MVGYHYSGEAGARHDGGAEIVTHGLPEIDIGEDPEARTREADSWMAQRLREIDYDLTHPEAQLLADHLQSLGVGTLVNLKRSNKLLNACEKLIIRKLPPPPKSWHDESQRLIVVSVRSATPGFITRSMRKWDPRGAAISTYFVNYCLFAFKKVYLEYWREEVQGYAERPISDVIDMFETTVAEVSSEDLAVARQTIREVAKLIDSEEFAEIVLLTARGLTRKQIAEELGISVSSLDRHITEYRRKLEVAGGWSIKEDEGNKGTDGEQRRG